MLCVGEAADVHAIDARQQGKWKQPNRNNSQCSNDLICLLGQQRLGCNVQAVDCVFVGVNDGPQFTEVVVDIVEVKAGLFAQKWFPYM